MWPFSSKPKAPPTGDATSQRPIFECASCNGKATFHLTWAEDGHCVSERHLCEGHARQLLIDYKPPARCSRRPLASLDGVAEYEIDLIVICEIHDQQVVYLREVGGERFFPMLIGIFEATCLDRRLRHTESPRPLTHDVAASILTTLGGQLEHVLVDRLVENCWCAHLHLLQNGERLTVDVRPSDAFVFALLLERPIFVSDDLVDKVLPLDR